jgi:hypothetical protein
VELSATREGQKLLGHSIVSQYFMKPEGSIPKSQEPVPILSLFHSGFPSNYLYAFLLSTHSCYMPRPSHPPRLHYSNYTWRRVQIMELSVMQFSSFSRHLISLWSKYPPQHLVLKCPQPMFLP